MVISRSGNLNHSSVEMGEYNFDRIINISCLGSTINSKKIRAAIVGGNQFCIVLQNIKSPLKFENL